MSQLQSPRIKYGNNYYNFISNKTCVSLDFAMNGQKVYGWLPNRYQNINEGGHCTRISITLAHMFLKSSSINAFAKSLSTLSKSLVNSEKKVEDSVFGQKIDR